MTSTCTSGISSITRRSRCFRTVLRLLPWTVSATFIVTLAVCIYLGYQGTTPCCDWVGNRVGPISRYAARSQEVFVVGTACLCIQLEILLLGRAALLHDLSTMTASGKRNGRRAVCLLSASVGLGGGVFPVAILGVGLITIETHRVLHAICAGITYASLAFSQWLDALAFAQIDGGGSAVATGANSIFGFLCPGAAVVLAAIHVSAGGKQQTAWAQYLCTVFLTLYYLPTTLLIDRWARIVRVTSDLPASTPATETV